MLRRSKIVTIMVITLIWGIIDPYMVNVSIEEKSIPKAAYIDFYEPTSSTVWNICDGETKLIRWDGWAGSGVDLYLYKGQTKKQWLGFFGQGVSSAQVNIDSSLSTGSDYCIKAEDVGWDMDVGWSDYFTIKCSGTPTEPDEDEVDVEYNYGEGANSHDIHVEGNYAYIADSKYALVIIDVSDPLHPDTENFITEPLDCFTKNIAFSDDFVYFPCSDEFHGLAIYDVSDPTDPKSPILQPTDGETHYIDLTETYAFLTISQYWDSSVSENVGQIGIAIIDISDPLNPGEPSYIPLDLEVYPYPQEIKIFKDHAFVACSENIAVVDVSDPLHPGTPSYFSNGSSYLKHLCFYGNTLFAAEKGKITLWNVTVPTIPELISQISLESVTRFSVIDNLLFYSYSQYFKVVDISAPENPKLLETKKVNGIAEGFCISGIYAYIADNGGGIKVFSFESLVSSKIDGGTQGQNIVSYPQLGFVVIATIIPIILYTRRKYRLRN